MDACCARPARVAGSRSHTASMQGSCAIRMPARPAVAPCSQQPRFAACAQRPVLTRPGWIACAHGTTTSSGMRSCSAQAGGVCAMRPGSTFPARKSRRARTFPAVSRLSANWSDTFAVHQSCPASIPYPAPVHKAGAALVRQCARRPASPGQPTGHMSTTHASCCAPFTGRRGKIVCAVWRVRSGPYSQKPTRFAICPNPDCCCATAIPLPSRLRCWDGACPGSDASVFRRSRAARETIRRLDCLNGWPSCLPICRPPSTRRTGCTAISFTHLSRRGTHGVRSLPGCRKAVATPSLHFFSPRACTGWIILTTGMPWALCVPRKHVVPLREAADRA